MTATLICIYCAVGQKESAVAQVVATLQEAGAMEHTIVVLASASEPAALQYMAPFAACTNRRILPRPTARTPWSSTTT